MIRGFLTAAFCVLLTITPGAVRTEELPPEEVTILPDEYYIGELVTVQMRIGSSADAIDVTPYTETEDQWFQIKSIDTIDKGGSRFLYLRVIPYFPGERALPAINYGGKTIKGPVLSPRVHLDGKEHPFHPVRQVLPLPGSKLILLGALLLAAFLLTVGLILGKRFKLLYKKVKEKIRVAAGRFIRRKSIRYLRKNCADLPPREIYKILNGSIRDLLTREFDFSCRHLSSSEIADTFSEYDEMIGVLNRGDFVRFGHGSLEKVRIWKDIEIVQLLPKLLRKNGDEIPRRSPEC